MGIRPITPQEFLKIRELLSQTCGIVLKEDQDYLVESRLSDMGNETGVGNFEQLYQLLLTNRDNLLSKAIDLLATHETFWFRDDSFWNMLKRLILPEMFKRLEAGTPFIRIWSAACSSGQEPYSLAILIDELCQQRGTPDYAKHFDILGTDFSDTTLSLAKAARYNDFDIKRGLSENRQNAYFIQKGAYWHVCDNIRKRVDFQQFNLQENFKTLGSFHLVLCRNVTVYFSSEVKKEVFRKMSHVLTRDGMLFLGASEILRGYSTYLTEKEFEGGVYYQLA